MEFLTSSALMIRLLATSAAFLLVPGFAILTVCRVRNEWPERTVFAFAVSYSWIFLLSILLPISGWSVDHAALLTVLLVAGAVVALVRRRRDVETAARPAAERLEIWLLAVVVIAFALIGWIREPPFTGEEALDFASVARFADGGPITFENTWLLANARAMYLFQPFQLVAGAIARWSAIDPLIAFVKLRAFFAPLCLVSLYALLRRLAPTRVEAGAAFSVILLFICFNFRIWEENSLIMFVRRGSVTAGALVPALMVLCVVASRRMESVSDKAVRRAALVICPFMLVATLSTHALEVFTLLCFAGALATAIVVGLDREGDRRFAVALVVALILSAGAYVAVQQRTVSYITDYERQRQVVLRDDLRQMLGTVRVAIAGGVPEGARDLLSRATPETVVGVVGVPSLLLAALRVPGPASILALASVPLMLVFATPAGYTILALLTSDVQVQAANQYLALLGLLSVGLGLVATAQVALTAALRRRGAFRRLIATAAAGSAVLWIAWMAEERSVQFLITLAVQHLPLLLLLAALVAAAVIALAAVRKAPLVSAVPFPAGVALLTICLTIPLGVAEWSFGGAFGQAPRVTVIAALKEARSRPSVLEWPSYYEYLQDAIAPRLPIPREVVDELRRRLPPRQVLLANPRYSCAVVVLTDAYCINPEQIYGHAFLPATHYYDAYVADSSIHTGTVQIHNEDASARDADRSSSVHPFFNAIGSISDAERRLLADYGALYILADPEHAELIDRKLHAPGIHAALETTVDGYRLYSISAS